MTDDILNRVSRIIAEQALIEPDQLDPDAGLQEMGLDSLALVEGIYAIEEEFDVHLPFNANSGSQEHPSLRTARTVASEVERLIAAKSE